MNVVVLLGGLSAEREVSLISGGAVARALRNLGHTVRTLDPGADLSAIVAALTPAPDVVFNALHGRFGEDGTIQGVLDWMGIPYTHSGVRASALAMDKVAAKTIFAAAGLPVCAGMLVSAEVLEQADPWPLPYVVKPANEGSSVGVHIFQAGDNRRAEIARTWTYGPILAEPYIPGRELTVGVLGTRALGVTEIIAAGFYDYAAKYSEGGSSHVLPARIGAGVYADAQRVAVAAHAALGCSGASRADFRYDDAPNGRGLVLLEVNTQPGMTPTSLLPEQAEAAGMDFAALCQWMLAHAGCRR